MTIFSLKFIALVIAVTGVYFVVPKKWQWVVVLIGNTVFYRYAGIRYLVLVLAIALISYIVALNIQKTISVGELAASGMEEPGRDDVRRQLQSIRQFICGVAVVIVAGVWVFLKYSAFFTHNINIVLGKLKESWQLPEVSWVLPLGMSFYTFHIIGYVVDVYRGKYPAERNFAKYFTFVTYFPHIIQGPFSRFDLLGRSILEEHSFSYDRLCEGCARILWGAFKKLLIADKLSIAVTTIFADYADYPGIYSVFGVFAYCIELYADFSGYMDIMCGLSHIWGINLAENFKRPYFARTIDEFWRRWHITLGAWFKDYVFYPVSMGKIGQKLGRKARKKWGAKMGKLVPGYFALVFVWTATGLWHGANWTYLVWGYLNLLVILSTMQFTDFYDKVKKKCHIASDSRLWNLFCIVRTFALVCFFRFFSIQPSLHIALSTLKHMVTHLQIQELAHPAGFFVGMDFRGITAVLVGTILLFAVDLLEETGVWSRIRQKTPFIIRDIVYAAMIIMIILLSGGSTDLAKGFMYAAF